MTDEKTPMSDHPTDSGEEPSTDTQSEQTYRVPLIDPETGDDYDVVVKATSARRAAQQAHEEADGLHYLASSWAAKHLDLEDPHEAADE